MTQQFFNDLFYNALVPKDTDAISDQDRFDIIHQGLSQVEEGLMSDVINTPNDSGYSIFHRALQGGHVAIISMPIMLGGNLEAKVEMLDQTPLEMMESINHNHRLDAAIELLKSAIAQNTPSQQDTVSALGDALDAASLSSGDSG